MELHYRYRSVFLHIYSVSLWVWGVVGEGGVEYLVSQVSFLFSLVSAVSCILSVCWRFVPLQVAGDFKVGLSSAMLTSGYAD